MDKKSTQGWKRLAAIGAAIVLLIITLLGGGSLSQNTQQAVGPLATIAAAGDIELDLGAGGDDGSTASSDQGRRRTPTPTVRPRRTPTVTPTRTPARRTPTVTPTRAGSQQSDDLPVIYENQLPREARTTLRLIEEGGPFPYDKDGSVFQNREGLLPSERRGYYREYTVITPGEDDRGARRIVAGEGGELYYTDDHYDSFQRIVER